MVNGAGSIDNAYQYDPWGQRITNSGSAVNPFKFSAGYQSTSSGLFDFAARTYDPGTGRFTQADPRPSSVTDINRFAYVGCNPVNATDPSGLGSGACVLAAIDTAALVAGAIASATLGPEAAVAASAIIGLVGVATGATSLGLSLAEGDPLGGVLGGSGIGFGLFASVTTGLLERASGFLGVANALYGWHQCLGIG